MKKRLKRFSELDGYKIHKKDKDVHDWIVRGDDNQVIGFVNDLLVDIEAMKVAFLEVSLSDYYLKMKGRHSYILVPMNKVELDRDTEEVLVPMNERNVEAYPSYDSGIITPAYLFELQNHHEMIERGTIKGNDDVSYNNNKTNYKDSNTDEYKEERIDNYELSELKVKYLELKKELKIARAEREVAILERDIAFAQMKKEKIETGMDRKYQYSNGR